MPTEITFMRLLTLRSCNEVAASAPPKQREILDEAGGQ